MSARRWGLWTTASTAAIAWLAGAALGQPLLRSNKPVATVNGEAITQADVDAVLKERGPMATPASDVQRRQIQLEAVHMLIDDLLMQQYLRKNGPRIDPAEVDRQMKALEESQRKIGKTVQDYFRETGQTEAQVRTNVVHALQLAQWIEYVKKQLSEADVQRYYEENRDFFDRVAVRASHIVLRVPATAPPAERQAARTKLQALRQEIAANKITFADAAKKYSQCTSAPEGGDIGFFPRKFLVEESIAKIAFSLKVGQVSDVVDSDYGVHLVMVTDRKPGQPSDYNKIKEEVRELCVEELRLTLLAQQRKASQIEINLP